MVVQVSKFIPEGVVFGVIDPDHRVFHDKGVLVILIDRITTYFDVPAVKIYPVKEIDPGFFILDSIDRMTTNHE